MSYSIWSPAASCPCGYIHLQAGYHAVGQWWRCPNLECSCVVSMTGLGLRIITPESQQRPAPATTGWSWGRIAASVVVLGVGGYVIGRAVVAHERRTQVAKRKRREARVILRIARQHEQQGRLVRVDLPGFRRPPVRGGRIGDVWSVDLRTGIERIVEVETVTSARSSHSRAQHSDLGTWQRRAPKRRRYAQVVVKG